MSAAKTFDEWWLEKSYMCWAGVTHSAKEAWNAALESVEIAPSASANSQSVAALVKLIDDNCEVVTFKDIQWVKRSEVVECLNVGVPTLHT